MNINRINYTVEQKRGLCHSNIVLLHGWAKAASIDSLTPLQTELSNLGYKVWNIEIPGFGKSKEAPDNWGIPEFAKLMAEFIQKELGDEKYSLFGHSFGGSLTAYISAHLEPKPTNIILCSSAGIRYKTLKAKILLPVAKIFKSFLVILPKKLRNKLRKNIYYYLIRERDYVDTSDKKEQFVRVTNHDLTDTFKNITTPTLIIWGKDDKITPLSMGNKIEKLIKDSKMKVIEGRHGIPITKTKEIAGLISTFLGK